MFSNHEKESEKSYYNFKNHGTFVYIYRVVFDIES